MIPKEIKDNLHYDDVRGDFTATTSHSTSYSRVNKSKKGLPLERNNTQNHENPDTFYQVSCKMAFG